MHNIAFALDPDVRCINEYPDVCQSH
jgi:hypothetical protein